MSAPAAVAAPARHGRSWHSAALTPVRTKSLGPARELSEADYEDRFWERYLRFGWLVLLVESAGIICYADLSGHGPATRDLIAASGSVFAAAGRLGVLVSQWLARQRWRQRLVVSSCLVLSVAVAGLAVVDGGIDSPLLGMLLIPIVYVATVLPSRVVVAVATASVLEIAVVGLSDRDVHREWDFAVAITAVAVGAAVVAVGTARQRDDLRRRQSELAAALRRTLETDSVTGCANFSKFQQFLVRAVELATSNVQPLTLVYCDLDNLRAFNATHGDSSGDEAIVSLAASLADAVNDPSVLVARIGGDELVLVLPGRTSAQGVALASAVIDDRRRRGLSPGVSIGVAQLDPDMPTSMRLLRDAEQALAAAKSAGGDRVAASSDALISSRPATRADRRQIRFDRTVRHAVRQLDELRAILTTLIEDAPAGLTFVDQEGRVLVTNDAGRESLRLGDAPVGRRLCESIIDAGESWCEALLNEVRQVLDRAQPIAGVEINVGESFDRPARSWLASLYPVRLGADLLGVGIVTVDITDQKRMERAQEELTAAAVQALGATAEARDPLHGRSPGAGRADRGEAGG